MALVSDNKFVVDGRLDCSRHDEESSNVGLLRKES